MYLKELAKKVNKANRAKGFYDDNDLLVSSVALNNPELLPVLNGLIDTQRLALITTETSEHVDALRSGFTYGELTEGEKEAILGMDDEEFTDFYKKTFKGSTEEEHADGVIRYLDMAGENEVDLDFHIEAKLRFNSLRPHKHGKKF